MSPTPGGTPERPALFFADRSEWRRWLEAHHGSAPGLWMGLWKRHVPDRGLVWADAVEEALCFGWIDSVAQRIDADATRQRWTPRRRGSIWSPTNVASVERLTAAGLMHPAGLAAFEARRRDDERSYAYENRTSWPAEFEAAVQADAAAAAFLALATPSYLRVAQHWVVSAKREETRLARLQQYIEDAAAGRLVPTQRYGDPPAWLARARTQLGLD